MARRALPLTFLAVVIALATVAEAAPKSKNTKAKTTKAFPFPMETHALPNGLKVVFIRYDSPGLAAYYTAMRVGSRNEPEKGRSGYAHFFEHMMFRGTKRHSGEEYNQTVTRLGLATNAFTSEDMTIYHLFGPQKALPTIIEYEADRFQNLDYSEDQFKTEAGAILGEYAKSASNPEQKINEVMAETAFTEHTYRHTTIGYLDDVKAMPGGYVYSREFFRRYYTPDNATVFVVGDFDPKATLTLITAAYSGWKGKLDAAAVPVEPAQKTARTAKVDWPRPTLPRLWMAWHAPGVGDLKATAIQNVLSGYLFGPTSTLHQDLVLGKQLVDTFIASYETRRDAGLFGTLARVKKPSDVATVEAAVKAQIAELAKGNVDKKRLDAVRSNLKYSAILALNTADVVAVTAAVNTAQTGDLEFMNKLYVAIDALKPEELAAFARTYLTDGNSTTVTLSSQGAAK